MVIVAINYRLGPIGFLSMGTEEVPGKLILSILYFYIIFFQIDFDLTLHETLISTVWTSTYLGLSMVCMINPLHQLKPNT